MHRPNAGKSGKASFAQSACWPRERSGFGTLDSHVFRARVFIMSAPPERCSIASQAAGQPSHTT
jgi:hypothetical protein